MHRARPFFAPLLSLLIAAPFAALGGCDRASLGALKRFMYEHPGRDRWQKPEEVVAALGLEEGDFVADLGAGGGYFTFPLAEEVGESGRVYAVDVDEALLAYVARQSGKRGLPQVVTVKAAESAPGLEAGAVDLVFLANVFHHLPEPDVYFANARGILRPGGRVAIVETDRDGLLRGHSTPPEVIEREMTEAGYALVERHAFLEWQSFQVFAPRRD